MNFKKLLKFVTTHEGKAKKVLDWVITVGNGVWLIFRVLMNAK